MTIQSICKAARDENEVREAIEAIWPKPTDADRILRGVLQRNEDLYRFETMLERVSEKATVQPTTQRRSS